MISTRSRSTRTSLPIPARVRVSQTTVPSAPGADDQRRSSAQSLLALAAEGCKAHLALVAIEGVLHGWLV